MKNKHTHILYKLSDQISSIDYNQLPISDYNKSYINNLKPAITFYLKIYADCLEKGIQSLHCSSKDITLIDYGGGSGFLSLLAKVMGFGKVIYIDLNPLSVETIHVLKKEIGIGPDVILHGNSDVLTNWCLRNGCKPQLLIATDLIEHIYDLQSFFKDLITINDQMSLIFTTASTPYNPFVKHRLHQYMKGCENGVLERPNYYTKREQFIKKLCPQISEEELSTWTKGTRGLIFSDIEVAFQKKQLPKPLDPYNTCDPSSGNWTERILPIKSYKEILSYHKFSVTVEKGFYNANRKNRIFNWICKSINLMIKISGPIGFLFAPFIILTCRKK